MNIAVFTCNPFGENTYVASWEDGRCIIVDCGAYNMEELRAIEQYIAQNQLHPIAQLLTHAHLDHCFGVALIEERYGLLPFVSEADKQLLESLQEQCSMFGIPAPKKTSSNYIILSAEKLKEVGLAEIEIIPCPGHTPGGVCYLIKDTQQAVLFCGDSLFMGSIGRTDLPGGDYSRLMRSIQKITQLDEKTIVYPGHGPSTTIAQEKHHNPFLQ